MDITARICGATLTSFLRHVSKNACSKSIWIAKNWSLFTASTKKLILTCNPSVLTESKNTRRCMDRTTRGSDLTTDRKLASALESLGASSRRTTTSFFTRKCLPRRDTFSTASEEKSELGR